MRSPSNPVLTPPQIAWAPGSTGLLVDGVVPTDGADFESGTLVYFSPLGKPNGSACGPYDTGRAASP